MQRPNIQLGERGYEAAHVNRVLAAMKANFPNYFNSFWTSASAARAALQDPRDEWDKDRKKYLKLLDAEFLEEFEEDPNAFKSTLKKDCPIIQRCLNSNVDEMKDYKIKFNMATGDELLRVTQNLVDFANAYMDGFDDDWLDSVREVDDLELDELGDMQNEDYTAFGVIGGGIKSHFLYSLYPQAFPNRSQNAIWALYYLSGKDDFGFHDGSEFLMMHIEAKGAVIQQNYHYPYDLFAFYALQVYRWFETACSDKGLSLDREFRFVHLDAFLNHISDKHRDEIRMLKGTGDYEYAG